MWRNTAIASTGKRVKRATVRQDVSSFKTHENFRKVADPSFFSGAATSVSRRKKFPRNEKLIIDNTKPLNLRLDCSKIEKMSVCNYEVKKEEWSSELPVFDEPMMNFKKNSGSQLGHEINWGNVSSAIFNPHSPQNSQFWNHFKKHYKTNQE